MHKIRPDKPGMIITSAYLALIVLVSTLFMTGCNAARRNNGTGRAGITNIEDFDAFYDRFHTDSAFQMSRITFPLGGMSVDGDGRYEWTRDNWHLMKVRIYDVDTSLYRVSSLKTERDFVEKIWIEDSGFSSEYRFELIDGRWYLVYVLDQNL